MRVEVGDGSPPRRLMAGNISCEGMFLRSIQPLPVGTAVSLALEAKGRPMAFATGMVVWVREGAQPVQLSYPPGFGVRFTSLSPNSRALLEFLIGDGDVVKGNRAEREVVPRPTSEPKPLMTPQPFTFVDEGEARQPLQVQLKLDGALELTAPAGLRTWQRPSTLVGVGLLAIAVGAVGGWLLSSPREAPAALVASEAGSTRAAPTEVPEVATAAPAAEPAATAAKPEPTSPQAVSPGPAELEWPEAASKPGAIAKPTEGANATKGVPPVEPPPAPAANKPEEPVRAGAEALGSAKSSELTREAPAEAKVPGTTKASEAAVGVASARLSAPSSKAELSAASPKLETPREGTHRITLPPSAVRALTFEVKGHEVVVALEVHEDAHISRSFYLSDPPRVVVDVDGAAPTRFTQQALSEQTLSRLVRVAPREEGMRLVIELSREPLRVRRNGKTLKVSFSPPAGDAPPTRR